MRKAFDELCKLTTQAIVKYRMIQSGDRILLGLSGGKDSFVLAHVLHHLQRRSPIPFEVVCGTFDPGFPEFDLPTIRQYAQTQNWVHEVAALPIAEILEEKQFRQTPCILCSRLRRGTLYGMARRLNCSALALAQHFDDIAVSFLMSLFRGQGLTTMGPNIPPQSKGACRIVRPFIMVPETLIMEVRDDLALPLAGSCQYESLLTDKDRAYFRRYLDELSGRIPHLRSQMLRSLSNVQAEFLLDNRFAGKRFDNDGFIVERADDL